MKKLIAVLLAAMIVCSICTVFTFAESKNIALGCTVTGAEQSTHDNNKNYGGKLTDGKAADGSAIGTEGEWFCYYQHPDADPSTWNTTDTENRIGIAVIDLKAVCTVENVRVHLFTGNHWGIIAPKSVTVSVSENGTDYTKVGVKEYEKIETENMMEEWSEFKLENAASARYVKVEVALNGLFAFLNEIEVIGERPSTTHTEIVKVTKPVIVEGMNWERVDNGGVSCNYEVKADGSVVFSGSVAGTWPRITGLYAEADRFAVDVENGVINYDITVADGDANVSLVFVNGDGTYTFPISNTALGLAEGQYDAGGGDLHAGEFKGTLALKDLVEARQNFGNPAEAFNKDVVVDGKLTFAGVQVYSVSGGIITIKTLNVAYDEAREVENDDPTAGDPTTGDAGIILFALIAVISAAGVCATVKARG